MERGAKGQSVQHCSLTTHVRWLKGIAAQVLPVGQTIVAEIQSAAVLLLAGNNTKFLYSETPLKNTTLNLADEGRLPHESFMRLTHSLDSLSHPFCQSVWTIPDSAENHVILLILVCMYQPFIWTDEHVSHRLAHIFSLSFLPGSSMHCNVCPEAVLSSVHFHSSCPPVVKASEAAYPDMFSSTTSRPVPLASRTCTVFYTLESSVSFFLAVPRFLAQFPFLSQTQTSPFPSTNLSRWNPLCVGLPAGLWAAAVHQSGTRCTALP